MSPPKKEFERFTLDNGLRVLVRHMRDISHAALVFMMPSGSRYETEETSGLAHFCEHLLCCGGKRYRSTAEAARALEGIGGDYNMYTDPEVQFAVVQAPGSEIRTACDVLSDILGRPRALAGVVERERRAILQEIAEMSDNPAEISVGCFKELFYGGRSWMWDPLGSKENVLRFSREDLLNYHRAHYAAEDAILSVAGGVRVQEVEAIANRFFSRLPLRSAPKPPMLPFSPRLSGDRIMRIAFDRHQAHATLGVLAPPVNSSAESACEVLVHSLGSGSSSRLFRKMRGIVYSVGADYAGWHDHGLLLCGAAFDPAKTVQAVELLMRTCRSFVETPIDERECEKTRRYIQGRRARSELPSGVAALLAAQEFFYGGARPFAEYIHECDRVTAIQVTALAEELFQPERFLLGLAGPLDESIVEEICERVPEFQM